jgi:hypothetical protein
MHELPIVSAAPEDDTLNELESIPLRSQTSFLFLLEGLITTEDR